MKDNPILREIRETREEIARENGYDIKRVFAFVRERERVIRILNAMPSEEQVGLLEELRRGDAQERTDPNVSPSVLREDERDWGGRPRQTTGALRLYIDTSVVGGYFDKEWQEATRELWRQWREGRWAFVTSVVTAFEVEDAPERVGRLFAECFPETGRLALTDQALALAGAYLDAGVVSARYEDDARHVAVCSLAGCDFLVSWNFRHMVNVRREAGFNAVNLLRGHSSVRIVSPLELIYCNENEEKEI